LDKNKQYPIYARKQAASREHLLKAQEEVVLDLNELAVEGDYLSVRMQHMGTNHKRLAYLENRDGSDRYTIYVKNLETVKLLPDEFQMFFYGSMEWSQYGEYIFYITVDESQRPYQLWQHHLGSDASRDQLIFRKRTRPLH
jgi:oligopeptidase B